MSGARVSPRSHTETFTRSNLRPEGRGLLPGVAIVQVIRKYKNWWITTLAAALLFGVAGQASAISPRSCESLAELRLPHTKIVLAQLVPAGGFIQPRGEGLPGNYKSVPSFCRVVAEAKPSADSDIRIEVWMPASGWNGNFRGEGNGGFAGGIGYGSMALAVKQGLATAGTDTGHTGTVLQAGWALNHPQKVIDFGYHAIHKMTLTAKTLIKAFYGRRPEYSYFTSCSDGGREALMEAQRFPGDYDGILAGAPANNWTHLFAAAAWDAKVLDSPGGFIPSSKLPAISKAVLAACDAQDGLADGLVTDPRRCNFDPSVLLCKGADSNSCLTERQVAALKKIYAGPHDSNGHQIYPGLAPGGEQDWAGWVMGSKPGASLLGKFAVQYFANMVCEQPDWNLRSFRLDQSTRLADQKTARALDAINPNLKPFMRRGGKLIIYQGWSDPAVPALGTIDYYQSVVAKLGQRETNSFLRLFMVPGMGHCGGGPGPNYFGQDGDAQSNDPQRNIYAAIEQWVEKDVAPSRIIATKYAKDSKAQEDILVTRPLCPYPQVARYKGTGNTNKAANFVCSAERER